MRLDNIEQKSERIIEGLTIEKTKTPEESFRIAADFIERLRNSYPAINYPRQIEAYDPVTNGKKTTSYFAREQDRIIGLIMGINDQIGFNAQAFIVDPKYQGTNVAESLIRAMQADCKNIRLVPMPIAWKNKKTVNGGPTKPAVLTRYYKRFGFNDTGTGLMTWEKQQNDKV